MALKIAINGFGRIGRCVTRVISKRDDVELVAINDVASLDMMLYLLQNDSVHGGFDCEVLELDDSSISIDGKKVEIYSETDPSRLDFAKSGADVVIECSGKFLTRNLVHHHIDKGVKKVIFSAPAQDDTPTFVLGVNEDKYMQEDIISNASCTTNCLGPIVKMLDDEFGIEKGLMTTIHSYTNDQSILDVTHTRDKRRARAAGVNIIPTSTGAAKALS